MARVIVITSGKGGVGKTTTTSNIGMALARLGKKVLLMDGDIGLRNLDLLLGLENRVVYTGSDVISLKCRLEQALLQDKREPNLTFFPIASSQNKIQIVAEDLIKFVNLLYDKYDFIFIDCPAGIDNGFKVATAAAQEAIVVVNPEVTSVRDADKVIGLLAAKGVTSTYLLINRLRPNMIGDQTMMSKEDIKDVLGLPVIGIIPDHEFVVVSSNRGEPLVLSDTLTEPGIAFTNTARRLIGERVEMLEVGKRKKENIILRFLKGRL